MKVQAMDTHSLGDAPGAWRGDPTSIASGLLAQARGLEIVATLATRLAAALMPALALVIGAALAVSTTGLEIYLQAALWAVGFLFYAFAVESRKPAVALMLLGTGVLVQGLALVSRFVAPELAVAGAAVVAAWLAVTVGQLLFRFD